MGCKTDLNHLLSLPLATGSLVDDLAQKQTMAHVMEHDKTIAIAANSLTHIMIEHRTGRFARSSPYDLPRDSDLRDIEPDLVVSDGKDSETPENQIPF